MPDLPTDLLLKRFPSKLDTYFLSFEMYIDLSFCEKVDC